MSSGQEQDQAWAQNRRLGRGVNIIGYDPLWESRKRARIREKHFRLINEAGFDSVRINLHPFKHMGPAPDYPIAPEWLATLDWAVNQALCNALTVILDMHEFTAMGQDPQGNKARFLATWRQLAQHCRRWGYPDRVLLELLNEPCRELTPALWQGYLQEVYSLVREIQPERTLIIGPAEFNSIDALPKLELPQEDGNIIVTVHYYRPGEFTHQGAHWSRHRDLSGIEWRGTSEEKAAIRQDFDQAQAWAEAQGRPLFLGEFGAYEKADMASRARWTAFVAREAEARGWSWAYWQFDSDFVAYDIENDRWVQPILDALIPERAS